MKGQSPTYKEIFAPKYFNTSIPSTFIGISLVKVNKSGFFKRKMLRHTKGGGGGGGVGEMSPNFKQGEGGLKITKKISKII